ncbi:MAG: hypothetical protein KAS04_04375 [Candidatus Aenigmarchaeota archaeon]|nr:hypothetical protein [Candidatus Aenigmarchaeota archaeon]
MTFTIMSSPQNIKVCIGSFGCFTKDQLIEEIEKGSAIGDIAIRMELTFIRKMPLISKRISA